MKQMTPLNFALLGLLGRHEATGYELMQVFATTPLGGYSSSPGAIYPALKKLRLAGLVDVAGEGASGRGDALALTKEGRAALTNWVKSEAVPGPGGIIDISVQMLKFTFSGDVLTLTQQRDFIDRFERALAIAERELRSVHDRLRDHLNFYDLLAVEAGIMNYETAINWCERARERLSAQGKEKRS